MSRGIVYRNEGNASLEIAIGSLISLPDSLKRYALSIVEVDNPIIPDTDTEKMIESFQLFPVESGKLTCCDLPHYFKNTFLIFLGDFSKLFLNFSHLHVVSS